jgi:hypothetical protein
MALAQRLAQKLAQRHDSGPWHCLCAQTHSSRHRVAHPLGMQEERETCLPCSGIVQQLI